MQKPTFAITYVERIDEHTVATRIWQGGFRLKRDARALAWADFSSNGIAFYDLAPEGAVAVFIMRDSDAARLALAGHRTVAHKVPRGFWGAC